MKNNKKEKVIIIGAAGQKDRSGKQEHGHCADHFSMHKEISPFFIKTVLRVK